MTKSTISASITQFVPIFLRQHIKISIVGLILVIACISWLVWTKVQTSRSATPQYQTSQVEKGTLVVSINAAGQIASTNSRTATTKISGVVKKILVANGDQVKTGAPLAEIELDQESQQSYTQALASYQSAKNSLASAQANLYSSQSTMLGKWDSFKELAESDEYKDTTSASRSLPEFVIPQDDWLAAEAQYKNQQAAVVQAQTALSSSAQSLRLASPTIYAPISGTVSGLSLQVGSVISSSSSDSSTNSTGQTIAAISTDALPTISVNLTEIDVTKVSIDDKVTITLDALPEKTFTGRVISIDTTGSVNSGVTSYPAVILFDTDPEQVLPNMAAQVTIITDSKTNVLLIPSSAIQEQNDQSTVLVMQNGQPISTVIETGLRSDSQTEVLSGLNEGDTLITGSTQTTTQATNQSSSPFSSFGGGFNRSFGGSTVVRVSR